MIALQLTDIKVFMNRLLRSELFDNFLLSEAVIFQDAAVTIDGHLQKDYFTTEELELQHLSDVKILPYSMLRPTCYQLIRGKKTPVYFKFVFLLSPQNQNHLLAQSASGLTSNDVNGIFLNLTYQNARLTLTTGISYSTFTAFHTLDEEWDDMMKKFLTKHDISFETL